MDISLVERDATLSPTCGFGTDSHVRAGGLVGDAHQPERKPDCGECNDGRACNHDVPPGAARRLASYLAALGSLAEQGAQLVSSRQIGELVGVNSAQVRRDIAHCGRVGKRGLGYSVGRLASHIRRAVGPDRMEPLVVIGAGSLGEAITQHASSDARGFEVVGIFDFGDQEFRQSIGEARVRPIGELERAVAMSGCRFGAIAVPDHSAQRAADRLCDAGIQVIANYSAGRVQVPDHVVIHDADPFRGLFHALYVLPAPDVEPGVAARVATRGFSDETWHAPG